ncbi:BlaI/MecI/CopY family transcriptional regulator [Candidatus Uhrbacteria bacterium]|nr:BlaI/MecI/CopY family transcriptional regulator [Candidatus Uhrbacteria bacterium]
MLSRLNIQAKGLQTFFGELEAKIMDHLWQEGPCSITCVKRALSSHRAYSFNTIMTVLNRLCAKGIVRKKKRGHTTWFEPVKAKEEFLSGVANLLVRLFVGKHSPLAMPHFLDALDHLSPSDRKELRKHLLKHRV